MASKHEPRIRVELFGDPPRVRIPGSGVLNLEPQPATILALLALSPNKALSRAELIKALWPDEGPYDASHFRRLRVTLSGLRAVPGLCDLFPKDADEFRLDRHSGPEFDILEFDRLLNEAAHTRDGRSRKALLYRAIDMYAGPMLPRARAGEIINARDRHESRIADVRNQLSRSLPKRGRSRALLAVVTAGFALAIVVGWGFRHTSPRNTPLTVQQRIEVLDRMRNSNSNPEMKAEQCIALAEEAWRAWNTPAESAWLAVLKPLDSDIQESAQWLLLHDKLRCLKLTGALTRYWWITDKKAEARLWLDASIAGAHEPDSLNLARALNAQASLTMDDIDIDLPRTREKNLEALVEIDRAHDMYSRLRDRWGQAITLRLRGHILYTLRRNREAERSLMEALAIFRHDNHRAWAGYTLWGLSIRGHDGERRDEGFLRLTALQIESVKLLRKFGGEWNLSVAFADLAHNADGLDAPPESVRTREGQRLLHYMITEFKLRLDRPEMRQAPDQVLKYRQELAQVAILAHDRPTAIEQLGYILSPYSRSPHRNNPSLAEAYLDYIRDVQNPPLSRFNAEQIVRNHPNPKQHHKHLSLEAAIRVANQ